MHQRYYKLIVAILFLIFVYSIPLKRIVNVIYRSSRIYCKSSSSEPGSGQSSLNSTIGKEFKELNFNVDSEKPATLNSDHLSLDPNITRRGEWQRKRISDYCQKHYLPHFIANNYYEYEHLIYDDEKKIVFCYVPKVGCSKWKYTFLLLNGKVKFTRKLPSQNVLNTVNKLAKLPEIERKRRLADYYKYVIVRNPMERIVSAYLDKIAKPLNINFIDKRFEETYKADILKALRPEEYSTWLRMNGTNGTIYPTFPEYVQYLNMINLKAANEHFRPIIHLCHPCAVNYNFYGNFKLLPKEASALLDQFKLNTSYYDTTSYISHVYYKTSDLVIKYFLELTALQKETLFYYFADELDFYYSLYPEEKGNHLNL